MSLTRNLQGDAETMRQQQFTIERRPFRIERLQLISTTEEHVPESLLVHDWDSKITQIQEDEDTHRTLVEFETRQQPLTQLTLATGSRNFSRKVVLEFPEEKLGKIDWKPIAEGVLSRFEFGDLQEEKLTLTCPESRRQTYRLVIENRDSPPLEVSGLQTAGPQDELIFLADPGAKYELHYGADVDASPDYDTAAIRHLLTKGVVPTAAELGEEVALSDGAGRKSWTFQRIINNRILLGSLIALAAIALTASLYQAGRKIGRE